MEGPLRLLGDRHPAALGAAAAALRGQGRERRDQLPQRLQRRPWRHLADGRAGRHRDQREQARGARGRHGHAEPAPQRGQRALRLLLDRRRRDLRTDGPGRQPDRPPGQRRPRGDPRPGGRRPRRPAGLHQSLEHQRPRQPGGAPVARRGADLAALAPRPPRPGRVLDPGSPALGGARPAVRARDRVRLRADHLRALHGGLGRRPARAAGPQRTPEPPAPRPLGLARRE